MANFTLQQLRYFCAVARTGSISAAAKAELVSRSTIAAALDELELSLQTRLFSRHKASGTVLTDSGHQVLDRALVLLGLAADLADSTTGSVLSGHLSVGCYPSLAPRVLPALVAFFTREHPGVELLVHSASELDLVKSCGSGEYDLVISYDLNRHGSLRTTILYETTLHVILPADHPLGREPVVSASDLAGRPLILADMNRGGAMAQTGVNAIRYLAEVGVEPTIFQRTDNFELIRSLVARGLGYSLVVQRPEADVSYEGRGLVALPLNPSPPIHRAMIAWSAGRPLSRLARTFIDAAHSSANDMHSTHSPAHSSGADLG